MKKFPKECKLCDREVTEAEGPVYGHLHGIFPITFCPECYSALDMFFSENVDDDKKLTKSVDEVISM